MVRINIKRCTEETLLYFFFKENTSEKTSLIIFRPLKGANNVRIEASA